LSNRKALGSAIKLKAFGLREQGLSLRRIAAAISAEHLPPDEPVSHASVGNWLKNKGLKAAWERRKKHDQTTAAAPVVALKVAEVEGDLGWTPKAEALFGEGLKAGASKRRAAHLAGLTEFDVDGWVDESARGVEPFASAIRRVRQAVASEVVAVCEQVKSGDLGYQARIRWLAAVDPDNWSDKPRNVESEQDRAAGMTDDELDAVIAAS